MKIAYVGIDLFLPALKSLLDCGCELLELFTCETDNLTEFHHGVTQIAKEQGAPVFLSRVTENDLLRLQKKGCQVLFSASYYYKIPLTDAFPMINIHPSLLPYGRGGWPMPYDILEKRPVSGVTFHKLEDAFDTGDIILQKSFSLSADENLKSFMKKVYALLPEMISELLSDFQNNYHNAKPQSDGVYLPMPPKSLYTVTPEMPFEQIDRILRAFYGYDCYYRTCHAEYRLIGASAVKELPADYENLTVFSLQNGFIVCQKSNVLIMKNH